MVNTRPSELYYKCPKCGNFRKESVWTDGEHIYDDMKGSGTITGMYCAVCPDRDKIDFQSTMVHIDDIKKQKPVKTKW